MQLDSSNLYIQLDYSQIQDYLLEANITAFVMELSQFPSPEVVFV